ncbi:MAG TPA: neutral zinc metallopeptidase [Caldilineaceae bacterium]|nr:neutral zinc metallopeptidase [Caldilineaceae bacterium]
MDTSQVEDRRGRSTGRAVALGGGGLGLLVMLVVFLLGGNPNDVIDLLEQAPAPSTQNSGDITTVQDACETGADANEREDCRVVGFVNSIQAFWTDEFARRGGDYPQAKTVLFTDATEAACGYASAAMGPFYCPRDQTVYLDLGFFNDLIDRLGAQGGPFAQGYVLAHEYGHHIQNLSGVLQQNSGATGPNSVGVQIELQADCLAGVWAHHATETGYLTQVTEEDVAQALDAAAAVGDDHIQRQTQGYVSPESWTHGSSAQRQEALMAGLQSGDLAACE